jgi:hypothetical protein
MGLSKGLDDAYLLGLHLYEALMERLDDNPADVLFDFRLK